MNKVFIDSNKYYYYIEYGYLIFSYIKSIEINGFSESEK